LIPAWIRRVLFVHSCDTFSYRPPVDESWFLHQIENFLRPSFSVTHSAQVGDKCESIARLCLFLASRSRLPGLISFDMSGYLVPTKPRLYFGNSTTVHSASVLAVSDSVSCPLHPVLMVTGLESSGGCRSQDRESKQAERGGCFGYQPIDLLAATCSDCPTSCFLSWSFSV
jgi:hypothetical protein